MYLKPRPVAEVFAGKDELWQHRLRLHVAEGHMEERTPLQQKHASRWVYGLPLSGIVGHRTCGLSVVRTDLLVRL